MYEFKKSTLEEVLSVLESGSRPSGGVDTESGTIPSLGGENISQDGRMYYGVIKKVHDGFCRNMPRGHLLPYDVLINKDGAQTGKVAIYKGDFPYAAINEHLFLMRGKSNVIEQRFLFHYLLFEATQQQIIKMITGSAQPGINSSFTKHIMINVPPTELQHRIAEILDTIDEAIQKTEALISKLKAMKQGLLHDLLTRGLDKNGKLRSPKAHPEQFKDSPLGRIPREWRVGSISSLAINHDNRRVPLKQADRDKRHGIYPYYGASGIIDWMDDYLFDGDFVLLGEDGENVVSRELPLAFRASGRFWVNNHAHVFEPLPEVDIRFLIALLEFTQYKKIIIGSAQPKITQDGLKRLLFRIPELDEQVLIAERFEIYDARIRTEEQYRDKLKLQKKGLMHDLLTGKVRVRT